MGKSSFSLSQLYNHGAGTDYFQIHRPNTGVGGTADSRDPKRTSWPEDAEPSRLNPPNRGLELSPQSARQPDCRSSVCAVPRVTWSLMKRCVSKTHASKAPDLCESNRCPRRCLTQPSTLSRRTRCRISGAWGCKKQTAFMTEFTHVHRQGPMLAVPGWEWGLLFLPAHRDLHMALAGQ